MNRELKELEQKIGYQFQDEKLFAQAMTHSSYANEHRLSKAGVSWRCRFGGCLK